MKKVLLLLTILLTCVVSVHAQSFAVDGINYIVTSESPAEVEVTGGEIRSVIEIPENVSYNGITYTVTSIGSNAFEGRTNSSNFTRKYIIPGTVRTIKDNALYDNYYLEEVVFNEGLQTIGRAAFAFNFALKEIRLPSTLLSIDDSGFYTNRNSNIPVYCAAATPPIINAKAFYGRTTGSLHVTANDVEAYKGAEYWMDFSNIIGDVKPIISMGDGIPFVDANVKAICVSNWDTDGDGELSLGEATAVSNLGEVFKNNNSITTFKELQYFIGLSIIDDHAFNGCSSLTSVTIPSSVTSIGVHAFDGCSSLTSITIPEGVTSIADYAYNGCSSLPSITIPESVTVIGENAFNSCSELTAVEVKNPTPVAITQNTFSNRTNTTLYVPTGSRAAYLAADYWKEFKEIVALEDIISFADAKVKAICISKWDTNGDGELSYAEAAVVTSIGEVFRSNASITSFNELQYFKGLKTIGAEAFLNCFNLSSITIPNSVTSIGERAFMCYEKRYSKLTSVILGNQLTTIGEYAFHNCNSLSSITIPNSVTSIGRCAFIYCSSLNFIILSDQLTTIEASTFSQCSSLSSITIPNNVTSIGNSAFGYCSSLTSINIPNNVASIGDGAFFACPISSITIPNSVTSLGSSAFNGCSSLNSVTLSDQLTTIEPYTFYRCTSLSSITIPNSVTSIGNSAFGYCPLVSITIPNSVTSIGEKAFSTCNALTSVIFGKQLTTIGTEAFYNCTSLSSITIPNSVTSIGNSAFSGCSSLASVTIPNSVTSIGNSAFSGCSSLSSITIPNSVTNIGNSAFSGCSSLASVTIPNGVTSIGSYAFQGCSSLSSVIIPNSVTSIGEKAFYGCSDLMMVTSEISTPFAVNAFNNFDATLVVPIGSRADYKKVSGWDFAFTFEEGESIFDMEYIDEQGVLYTLTKEDDDNLYYSVTGHSDELNTEIVIPADIGGASVVSIGSEAFYRCSGLTSVTIPCSVTSIGDYAFMGCSGLNIVKSEILMPFDVDAFDHFDATLVVPNGARDNYKSVSGWNFAFTFEDGETIYDREYIDGQGVLYTLTKEDDDNLYYSVTDHSDELNTEIVILADIGGIPVTSIGSDAFNGCRVLTSVIIPNSVTSIGEKAFYGCSGLMMVKSEISSPFDLDAFNSSNATLVVPKGARDNYKSVSGWNFAFILEEGETIFNRNQTDEQGLYYELRQADDYSLYYSVTGHSDELNSEIVIPSDIGGVPVTSIGSDTFNGCSGLTSVTIPNSVTSIGNKAFYGCSGLMMVTSGISTPFVVDAFNSSNATLVVPKGSRADYKSVSGWDFAFVFEEGETIFDREQSDEQGLYYTLRQADKFEDYRVYYSVTGHSDELSTEIVIPANLGGCPVRAIGSGLFSGCTNLISITIPKSVTTIGNSAFAGCSSLQSITIPNSVTTIGNSAFEKCSDLTSVKIGNGIKSIGDYAFWQCSSLTSITIPDSVTTIGEKAFHECSHLTSVILGDQLTSIGYATFESCISLSSITIPNNVTNIGARAFYGCSGLTSVTIGSSVTSLKSATFQGCWSLKTITIPNSVTSIEDGYNETIYYNNGGWSNRKSGVFCDCTSLTSVTIGSGETYIGSYAFLNCSNLTSVTIGSRVTSISDNTFYNCDRLKEVKIVVIDYSEFCNNQVVGSLNRPINLIDNNGNKIIHYIIPEGVTNIGESAFRNCRELSSITISNSVTSIGSLAFKDCNALTTVKLSESLTSLGEDVFPNSLKSIELPNAFTVIPDNLFSGNKFQYIKLGNNVKSIGKNAFGSSNPVIEISTSSPPTIASNAFPNVEYLSNINVIVPDAKAETAYRKVDVWNKMTFSNQNNIAEVTVDAPGDLSWELVDECNMMPAKVVGLKVDGTINADDFNQMLVNMKSLLRLDLSDCNITEIPDNAMMGKTQLQELILPTKLQTIGQSAFQNCTSLNELTLQAGLQTIGQSAFQNCTSLKELTPPTRLRNIGQSAFQNCISLREVDLEIQTIEQSAFSDCSGLQKLNLETQTIEQSAFSNCGGLQEVNLQTQTIRQNAFSNCGSLRELNLQAHTIEQSAFKNCSSLQKLNLQAGLQTIDRSAFEGCGSLTGLLDLPSTLISIGESAFVGTNFSSVKLSSALVTIGDNAFHKVPITQLTLPKKVASVGASAFAETNITGLVINGVPSIGDNAFADTPIEGHVTIPDGVTYLGAGAFRNSQLSTVFLPNSVTELSQGVFQGCPNLNLVYVPDNYTGLSSSAFDGCGALTIIRLSANLTSMGEYTFQNTPLEYLKVPSQVEVLPEGVLMNCKNLESLSLPASLKSIEAGALTGCTALRNLSVEAIEPPIIRDMSSINGINTDLCLISIPTQSYRKYVLAEYWGQFVQMRNDIAVETEGNGEIAFESVNEEEEEEDYEAREYGPHRAKRRAPQLASDEESMAIANNGSSIYIPQQGQVRFYILPAEGEKLLSATLDGVDIMPYIVDGVYTATADKRKAKLVVKFSGSGGSAVKAGDVNGDGDVDIADAVMIVNRVVGKPTPSFVAEAADVNNDGDIDIADAVRIVNLVVGKIPSLTRQFNYSLPDPQ